MAKKLALLIGVTAKNNPHYSTLKQVTNDVEAMRKVLKDPEIGGFEEPKCLNDPNQSQMSQSIESFFQQAKKDDLLLLYYSGHGQADDYTNLYLIAADTSKDEHGTLQESTTVTGEQIHRWMEKKSPAEQQVVILDCCYSGAFATGLKAKGGVNSEERLAASEYKGRVVLAASAQNKVAFVQEDSPLSIYTHYLVEALRTGEADKDGDGWINTNDLHEYIFDKIQKENERIQKENERPELQKYSLPEIYPVREGYKIPIAKASPSRIHLSIADKIYVALTTIISDSRNIIFEAKRTEYSWQDENDPNVYLQEYFVRNIRANFDIKPIDVESFRVELEFSWDYRRNKYILAPRNKPYRLTSEPREIFISEAREGSDSGIYRFIVSVDQVGMLQTEEEGREAYEFKKDPNTPFNLKHDSPLYGFITLEKYIISSLNTITIEFLKNQAFSKSSNAILKAAYFLKNNTQSKEFKYENPIELNNPDGDNRFIDGEYFITNGLILQSKVQIIESSIECTLKIIWDYSCIKYIKTQSDTDNKPANRSKVYEEYRTDQGLYRFKVLVNPSTGLKEIKNSVFKKAFDKDELFDELSNDHKSSHHAFKALREYIIDPLFKQYKGWNEQ